MYFTYIDHATEARRLPHPPGPEPGRAPRLRNHEGSRGRIRGRGRPRNRLALPASRPDDAGGARGRDGFRPRRRQSPEELSIDVSRRAPPARRVSEARGSRPKGEGARPSGSMKKTILCWALRLGPRSFRREFGAVVEEGEGGP